jgi:hypothetical protein
MGMSDEALLNRLNEHPELRSRVESMLLVVDDEMGNLQEADAAGMRLIQWQANYYLRFRSSRKPINNA